MPKAVRLLPGVFLFSSFFLCAFNLAGADDLGSVGIISSVSGEARIARADTSQSDPAKFRGPIIFGDRIATSKDSTIGLLVGENSLLTVKELSDVRIAEGTRNQQILEMANGRVCLAASQAASESLQLRTPTALITVSPGTLLHVDVTTAANQSLLPSAVERERPVRSSSRIVQVAERLRAPLVETYQVIDGSVDIVSLASSAAPTTLRTGQSLRIAGGVIGRPFVTAPVNCRVQNIQIIPPHTATPKAAQQMIVQDLRQTAAQTASQTDSVQTVAAMTQSFGGTGSSTTIPSGVILSTTPLMLDPPPTTRTSISVKLP